MIPFYTLIKKLYNLEKSMRQKDELPRGILLVK